MYSQRPLTTYTLTWFECGLPRVKQSKSFQQLLGIALDAGKSAHPVIVDERGEIKFPQPDSPNAGTVQVVKIYDPEFPGVTIYDNFELIAA